MLAAAVFGTPAVAQAQWKVVPLVAPPGGVLTSTGSINASGRMTGLLTTGNNQAFLTTDDAGGTSALGFIGATTPSSYTLGRDVNASGQVAGYGTDNLGRMQAFVTDANGANLRGLGFLYSGANPSFYFSQATGINDLGQVVGHSRDNQTRFQAFITGPNGTGMTGLGFLNTGQTGTFYSYASAINATGQVVGNSNDALGRSQAFITESNGSSMRGLGFLNTGSSGPFLSGATAVNARGQVVGLSYDALGRRQAFLTGDNGAGMFGLGFLNTTSAGKFESFAQDVNSLGQVVGWSYDVLGQQTAFLTGANGSGMRSIEAWLAEQGLGGWKIGNVSGINDNGWIAAMGSHSTYTDGRYTALLIRYTAPPTAVPEPRSLLLLTAGAAGMLAVVRRRRA